MGLFIKAAFATQGEEFRIQVVQGCGLRLRTESPGLQKFNLKSRKGSRDAAAVSNF